jgi:hypothetical protein
MPLPLSGLLVVSLEQAVAAPMCTCRLADAGARVIKVERPEGDFARYYDKLAMPREAMAANLAAAKLAAAKLAATESIAARSERAASSSPHSADSVHSPPQPNPGLPGFGHLKICRKRASPQPAGEGLGVGVARFFRRWRHRALTAPPPSPPLPHKGGGSTPSAGGGERTECGAQASITGEGQSAYFVWLNRGKESVVLDLARADDKALLAAMLAKADVFVQNLKPGAIAKLGFPLAGCGARIRGS